MREAGTVPSTGPARVLVTGADGYLAGRIARRWLETTDDRLVLWVRGAAGTPWPDRRVRLGPLIEGYEDRVEIRGGDLVEPEPFAGIDREGLDVIVHAAAITRFNADAETAAAVNRDGTGKLLSFARACSRLRSVVYLSSIYSSGLRAGPIHEEPFEGNGLRFANEYERSKHAAEALVTGARDLPWRILRVATVIAEDESGRVAQHNAFHNTLALLFQGLLSTVPGRRDTPLYFVTAEFVADAVCRVAYGAPPRSVLHLAHGRADSLTLGHLVDVAFDAFTVEPSFRRRGVLRPLFMDEEAFALLHEAVRGFAGPIVRQAMDSVAPFAPQLYVDKDVRNDVLRRTHGAYRAPDAEGLVRRTCAELLRTRWRREGDHART